MNNLRLKSIVSKESGKNYYIIWSNEIKSLEKLIELQKLVEAFHLLVNLWLAYKIIQINPESEYEISVSVLTTILNNYLVLLQRYNRGRILKVIEQKKKREVEAEEKMAPRL